MTNIAIPTFTLLAVTIALLLAFFLLVVKSKKRLSNRLFAAFLILTAIDISGLISFPSEGIWPKLDVLRSMLIFLHLPVFYLYIKSVCYSDFTLSRSDWYGVLPFVFVIGLLLPSFFLIGLQSESFVISKAQVALSINILLHLQVFFYLWLCFKVLIRFKELYVNNFAGNQLEAYQWLFRLTVALSLFYLVALIKNLFKFTSPELSEGFKISLLFFELVVLCWYLFQAISKPEIFKGIHSQLSINSQGTTEIDISKIKELQQVMKSEMLFLEPSISVKDVAERINMSTRDLSELLNKHLGKHFFDFINEYRIQEAKQVFSNAKDSKLTVLEVLYQVGFNSKSSFNTAFKKHTGQTPTAYRKSL